MRYLILLSVCILFSFASCAQGGDGACTGGLLHSSAYNVNFEPELEECKHQDWVLSFWDEFDGDTINHAKWQIQPWGQGNLMDADVQLLNRLENVIVSGGTATLITDDTPVWGKVNKNYNDTMIMDDGYPNYREFPYSSSNVWTRQFFEHGRYEIRFRHNNQEGFFPAFWVYNAMDDPVNDNKWNELDFFELETGIGEDKDLLISFHHDHDNDGNTTRCTMAFEEMADFSQWHTLVCEWGEFKTTFWLDGVQFYSRDMFWDVNANPVDCDHEETILIERNWRPRGFSHLIFNDAIKVDDGGLSANFPVDYEIDYIRYYQKRACCGELYIDDLNEIDFELNQFSDSVEHRMICAENITLADDIVIGEEENLTLVATEQIVIGPGVTFDSNSYFETSIQSDVTVCCDVTLNAMANFFTPDDDGSTDDYCVDASGATWYNVHVWTAPQGNHMYSGTGTVPPGQDIFCVWDGTGAQHDDDFLIVIELFNDCMPTDKPVFGESIVHVYIYGTPPPDNDQVVAPLKIETAKNIIANNPQIEPHLAEFISDREVDEVNPLTLKDRAFKEMEWYNLHPNPAHDYFILSTQYQEWSEMTIQIFDSQGKKVKDMAPSTRDNIRIDTSSLTSGLYNLRLQGNEVQTIKFIKQ